jgi:hypothetical protein
MEYAEKICYLIYYSTWGTLSIKTYNSRAKAFPKPPFIDLSAALGWIIKNHYE